MPSGFAQQLQDVMSMFGNQEMGAAAALANLPQPEAMRRLIDAFRWRCEEDHLYTGVKYGPYNPDGPVDDFKNYLDRAEQRKIVPGWWNAEKRQEVERMAMDKKGRTSIHQTLEKDVIMEEYDNDVMPMTLTMLSDQIFEWGVKRMPWMQQGRKG